MKQKLQARLVAAAAVVALALSACSASPPALLKADGVQRASVDGAPYGAELQAFRSSAQKLGAALLSDGGDGANGNVISSPGSLLIALAMLRAGATGETATEMDRVLGLPGKNRDEAMNALLASLEKFDGDPGSVDEKNPPRTPVLHVANGLFVDKGVPTGEGYLKTLAGHYGTGVYPVAFRDASATKSAMDAWVDKNTGGRIKKSPAPYDPEDTFSLLNAVYLASAWKVPFDPAGTSDLPFTTGDGQQPNVPTMQTIQQVAYAEGAGWSAVDLPYADGFVMRLVLPDIGTPGSGAPGLADAARALEAAAPTTVQIYLPKWDQKSSFDLRRVFASLGLQEMLQTESDFNAIQQGMVIKQAAQAANITVAEKGTVAAAVTQINAQAVSGVVQAMKVIRFDRPFRYEIVHVETGLPLFMGKVSDPR
ncbi:serpin family protein [Pseudarthrobacter albicanus]|uniref:serpin family protein n=1 Tax=Pseudarthrobacter albicanus TaxID=2823873 RepID=UPI001BA5AE82|nr:serpin family protein [Pseudarthrobacter albicanus]